MRVVRKWEELIKKKEEEIGLRKFKGDEDRIIREEIRSEEKDIVGILNSKKEKVEWKEGEEKERKEKENGERKSLNEDESIELEKKRGIKRRREERKKNKKINLRDFWKNLRKRKMKNRGRKGKMYIMCKRVEFKKIWKGKMKKIENKRIYNEIRREKNDGMRKEMNVIDMKKKDKRKRKKGRENKRKKGEEVNIRNGEVKKKKKDIIEMDYEEKRN